MDPCRKPSAIRHRPCIVGGGGYCRLSDASAKQEIPGRSMKIYLPRIRTPWIFRIFAGLYDALTSQEHWREHCRAMASLLPVGRILDLGIGPGVSGIEISRSDSNRRLVGLDDSATMLARARDHRDAAGLSLPLVRADAGALPFTDGAYDGAIGHSFLYLVDDRRRVLREIARVVRGGGAVAFLEPSDLRGVSRLRAIGRAYDGGVRFGTSMLLWSVFSRLHGRYTPQTLRSQLVECGFTEVRISSAFGGLGLVGSARRPAEFAPLSSHENTTIGIPSDGGGRSVHAGAP